MQRLRKDSLLNKTYRYIDSLCNVKKLNIHPETDLKEYKYFLQSVKQLVR